MITLVLVDDHEVVRTALRLLLERTHDIVILGGAADGESGLHLIQSTRPDVALIDVALPRMSGFALAEELTRREIPTRLLFLTAYESPAYVARAMEVGALGYVPKSAGEQEVLSAVRQVAVGRPYVSPSVAGTLALTLRDRKKALPSPLAALTCREREILDLVTAGRTTDEISAVLEISPHTVHRHRGAIMRKMGFHDRVELVRYVLANDLATDPRTPPAEPMAP